MIIKLLNMRLYGIMMIYLEILKDKLGFLITIKLGGDSWFLITIKLGGDSFFFFLSYPF